MISELDVSFVFRETIHGSFLEAVKEAARSVRASRAENDNSTMVDVRFVDYRICATAVELLLSDRRVLRISCVDDVVDWQFIAEDRLSNASKRYADEVLLKLPEARRVTWNPDALLRKRLNVSGLALAPTGTLVFLQVRGCPELMFGQMTDLNGRRILFFEEE